MICLMQQKKNSALSEINKLIVLQLSALFLCLNQDWPEIMCPEKVYGRSFLTHILFSMQLYLIVQHICKKILFSVPKAPKKIYIFKYNLKKYMRAILSYSYSIWLGITFSWRIQIKILAATKSTKNNSISSDTC